MTRLVLMAMAVAFLGFGCVRPSSSPRAITAPDIREQVNGIADAQEVLREQALLMVAAKSSGASVEALVQWDARARAAADLIVASEYEQAIRDLTVLNEEMRASLK